MWDATQQMGNGIKVMECPSLRAGNSNRNRTQKQCGSLIVCIHYVCLILIRLRREQCNATMQYDNNNNNDSNNGKRSMFDR